MDFHDFEIRAWVVDPNRAAVIVHSSPAGAMQRPEITPLDLKSLRPFRNIFMSTSALKEGVVLDEDIDKALNQKGLNKASIPELVDIGGRKLAWSELTHEWFRFCLTAHY